MSSIFKLSSPSCIQRNISCTHATHTHALRAVERVSETAIPGICPDTHTRRGCEMISNRLYSSSKHLITHSPHPSQQACSALRNGHASNTPVEISISPTSVAVTHKCLQRRKRGKMSDRTTFRVAVCVSHGAERGACEKRSCKNAPYFERGDIYMQRRETVVCERGIEIACTNIGRSFSRDFFC